VFEISTHAIAELVNRLDASRGRDSRDAAQVIRALMQENKDLARKLGSTIAAQHGKVTLSEVFTELGKRG
jgi:polysaccharide deacetylase 2 family uncharacterized protein YibQ